MKKYFKIILNNFSLFYFILLNIVLAIKMTTKFNDNLNEYFIFGLGLFGLIQTSIPINAYKKKYLFFILMILTSMLLLLLLNYKHYVTNIFIIKNAIFSIVYVFIVYLWMFLAYKYYKKEIICLVSFNLINAYDVTKINIIFSILSYLYFVIYGAYLL